MSNSLGPDQGRQNFGPDFGPNCLQRLITSIPYYIAGHSLPARSEFWFSAADLNLQQV